MTGQYTIEKLREAIAAAPSEARTGAKFVNIDTRVLENLLADSEALIKKREPNYKREINIVLSACAAGQRLCKSIRQLPAGVEITWTLQPSGKNVGARAAQKIIASNLLKPQCDGLFGDDTSQTWGAA